MTAHPAGFDWSPDGTRVAALVNGSLQLFDARNGAAGAIAPFTSFATTGFAWTSTQQLTAWSAQGIRVREPAGAFCASVDLTQYENSVDAVARDAAGNRSSKTAAALVKIDGTNPKAPTNLAGSVKPDKSIVLTWTASTDNVGVAKYAIWRNGVEIQQVTGTTVTLTGQPVDQNLNFQVQAIDAAGNKSTPATFSVFIP